MRRNSLGCLAVGVVRTKYDGLPSPYYFAKSLPDLCADRLVKDLGQDAWRERRESGLGAERRRF